MDELHFGRVGVLVSRAKLGFSTNHIVKFETGVMIRSMNCGACLPSLDSSYPNSVLVSSGAPLP